MSATMDLDAAPFAFLIDGDVAKHLPGQHDQSSHGSWAHGRSGWDGNPRTAKVEQVNGVAFASLAAAAGVHLRIDPDDIPVMVAEYVGSVSAGEVPYGGDQGEAFISELVRQGVEHNVHTMMLRALDEGIVTNRDIVLNLFPDAANDVLLDSAGRPLATGMTVLESADAADEVRRLYRPGLYVTNKPPEVVNQQQFGWLTELIGQSLLSSDDPRYKWLSEVVEQVIRPRIEHDLTIPSAVSRREAKRTAMETVAAGMSDLSLQDMLDGHKGTPEILMYEDSPWNVLEWALRDPSGTDVHVYMDETTERLSFHTGAALAAMRAAEGSALPYGRTDAIFGRSIASGRISDPEFADRLGVLVRESVARRLIDAWSSTSNKSPLARAIQEAARTEFGLDMAASNPESQHSVGDSTFKVLRSFVRAQYEATQSLLARRFPGATHLTLYRGGDSNARYSDVDAEDSWRPYDARFSWSAATLSLRPLASFSSVVEGARIFAMPASVDDVSGGKTVFAAAVPIERIFSTPFTGNGASIEAEFVVLGGPIHGRKQTYSSTISFSTPTGVLSSDTGPASVDTLSMDKVPPVEVLPVGATEFITINGVVVPIGKHADHDQSTHGSWATGTSEYRGQHTAPDRDSGAPATDLTPVYGPDVYGPNALRYFGYNGETEAYDTSKPDRVGSRMVNLDQQALDMAARVRNNPDATVTVYRAVPLTAPNRLNRGDWVTPSIEYARDHGLGPLNGTFKLLEATVTAGALWNDGNSLLEWGWDGDAAEVPAVLRKSTFRKHLAGSESDHDQSSHGSWADGSSDVPRKVHRVVDADAWLDVMEAVESDVALVGEADEFSEQMESLNEFIAEQLFEQAMAEIENDPEYADEDYDTKSEAAEELQRAWIEDGETQEHPDYREVFQASRLNREAIKAFGQRVVSDSWDVTPEQLIALVEVLPMVAPPGSTYADIAFMADAGDMDRVVTFYDDGRQFTVHHIQEEAVPSSQRVVASGTLDDPAVIAALKDHVVYSLINVWSESSNMNPAARALQQLAAEEFGVPNAGQQPTGRDVERESRIDSGSTAIVEAAGQPLRAFIRAQYEATQARLKLMFPGATHIRLYRGGDSTKRYTEGQSILDEEWESSQQGAARRTSPATLSLRPLASFGISTSYMSAGFFSAHASSGLGSTMFAADVPVERIFSTPLSGFGASQEGEMVVLGGPIAGVAMKQAISWLDRQVVDRADIPYGTTEFIMIDGQPVPIGKHLAGEHDQLSHGSWAQGRTGVPLDAVAKRALDNAKLGKRVEVTADDYRNPGALGPISPGVGQVGLLMKPEAIARIISEQGWDAPAARVTTEEFDELAKMDEFVVLYRGGPIGLSDGMEAGTPFIGDGYAGPGTYVTLRPERAVEYAFHRAISPREILDHRVTDNTPRAAVVRMLVPKSFIERSTSDRRNFLSSLNSPLAAHGSPIGWVFGMYTDDYVLYNTGAVILSPETPIFPEYALRDERDNYGNVVLPILKQDDLMEHGPYYAVVGGKAIPLDEYRKRIFKHLPGQHDQLSHGSWADGGGGGGGKDGSSWSREGWSELTAGGEEAVAKALKAKLDDILAVADEEDRRRFSLYTANKQLDSVDRIMDALFVAFEVNVTPEGRERIIRNLTYSRVFTKGESTLIVPPGWGTVEELVAEQQRVQGAMWSPLSSRMFGHLYDVTDAEIDSAMRMMERLQEVSPVSNAIVIITPTFYNAPWMGVTSAVSSAWAASRGLDTHIHQPVWQMAEMWSDSVHEAPSLPLTIQPFSDVSAIPWEWGMLFADNRRQVHLNDAGEPAADVKMEQSRRIISVNLPRIRSTEALSPEAFARAAPGYPEAVRERLLEWAVAHEWGHLVTTTTDRRRLFRFDDWFSGAVFRENESFNQLPQYSRSNADELWADTYAASLLAPELTQFRRIYEFGREKGFLPVSTVVTPEFITIDGNIIPLEKAVDGLVYSGIICTFPEGPPQYIGDVEKHLAGKHDQLSHGRWAHGIPHAVGDELDIDRLRKEGLLYRAGSVEAMNEAISKWEAGEFQYTGSMTPILYALSERYGLRPTFAHSTGLVDEQGWRGLARHGARVVYLIEPEEGHPWHGLSEDEVNARLAVFAQEATDESQALADAAGRLRGSTYIAPRVRFLPPDVWADAMAYSEMGVYAEHAGSPFGEGPRDFEGMRRLAETLPLRWLYFAAMDRLGPENIARYEQPFAQALWDNRDRIVDYVRQFESYDRMEVFLDGYQRARANGLEGKKAIEAGAALVARTGRMVSIDNTARVVALADELTSILPEGGPLTSDGMSGELDSWRRMVSPTDEERARTSRFLADARVAVAVTENALEGILNDGALKNQYQARTSNGLYKPTIRRMWESAYLGVDVEAPAKDRPIYGYLFYPIDGQHAQEFITTPSSNSVHNWMTEQYGTIRLVLKPEMNERATFTMGDSLDEPFLAAPLAGERSERQAVLSGSYLLARETDYDEAQVHGGVRLADVERITVTPTGLTGFLLAHSDTRSGYTDAADKKLAEALENLRQWRDVGFPSTKARIEQMLRAAGYDLPVTHDLEFITLPDGRVIPLEDV